MLRTWIVLPFLFVSLAASAADFKLDGFKKRFVVKRSEDGSLRSIKMKFLSNAFTLRPYIEQIKSDVKAEIDRMQNKEAYDAELDAFIEYLQEGSETNKEVNENIVVVREAMENLPNVDVEKAFREIQKHGVLRKFEIDLRTVLDSLDLSIVAYPNDARFFYRKNVTYQVVQRALEFAKKKFQNVPILNLVSFVIVQVHDMVIEQRTFHQNMLLHYLQNFTAEELEFSKKEADFVFSSIYESRIGALNLPESNRAASNWLRYGTDKFFTTVRTCNSTIRRSAYTYDSVNGRYNYAFVEVVENGERVVKNLVDTKHMFNMSSATAYNYAKPNKVKRTRALLNIGELALGFIPISGWIKAQVESFLESFYVNQRLTEGALVAYFESKGDLNMARVIKNQMANPYILFN